MIYECLVIEKIKINIQNINIQNKNKTMGNSCIGATRKTCMGGGNLDESFEFDTKNPYQNNDQKESLVASPLRLEQIASSGEDFQKYNYDCKDYDEDDEIMEMKNVANPFEIFWKVNFSKNGLIQHIKKQYELQKIDSLDPEIAKLWTLKYSNSMCNFWQKEDGDFYTIRVETTYGEKYSVFKLAECLYNKEINEKWDKNHTGIVIT